MNEPAPNSSPDHPNNPERSQLLRWLLPAGGLIIIAGLVIWGFGEESPYGSEPPEENVPAVETSAPAPKIDEPAQVPEATIVAAEPEVEPEPEPEPESEPVAPALTLAESDAALKADIDLTNGGRLAQQFVAAPSALERMVAVVDNLRQGSMPYKILPFSRPKAAFPFQDDGLKVTLDPAGFARYDALAAAIDGIDSDAVAALYGRYQSALEEAWAMLGYSDVTLDDAVMTTLGQILLAPSTSLDARLIRKEAVWIYEDEALEALPAVQKQLMRMGPENAEKIQNKVRDIRGALLDRAE
jgi:hypothetical protein